MLPAHSATVGRRNEAVLVAAAAVVVAGGVAATSVSASISASAVTAACRAGLYEKDALDEQAAPAGGSSMLCSIGAGVALFLLEHLRCSGNMGTKSVGAGEEEEDALVATVAAWKGEDEASCPSVCACARACASDCAAIEFELELELELDDDAGGARCDESEEKWALRVEVNCRLEER